MRLMRNFLILTIVTSLLSFNVFLQAESKKDNARLKDERVPVEVVAVTRQDVSLSLKATGSVSAYLDSLISAAVGGEVMKVYVSEGQAVRKNAPLIKTDDFALALQRDRAKANFTGMKSGYEYIKRIAVLQVETRLEQARASAASAKAQYEYVKNTAKLALEAKLASAQAARDTSAARLRQLKTGARPEERLQIKANLTSAQANYENASKNYERIKKLYAEDAVSSKQHDDVKTAKEAAEAGLKNATEAWNLAVKGGREEDIDAAKAALAQSEAGLKLVKREYDSKAWEKDIALAKAGYDQAAANLTLREQELEARAYEADIRMAEARDKDAQASLKIIQRQVDQTVIRAPFDGIVYGRVVEVGEMAAPGMPLIRVMQTDRVKIVSSIGETNSHKLHLNQIVLVQVDALPERIFTGRIIELSPAIDPMSRTISLKVELDNTDGLLKPGMFARLNIELEKREQALVIPKDALIQDGTRTFVYAVNNGRVVEKEVTLGLNSKDYIEILSGLAENETVVYIGQSNLSDGKEVKVVNQ